MRSALLLLILGALALSLSACSSSAPRRCQDCLTKATATPGTLSAQTLSAQAQSLLATGRAAQQRQDYTLAADLHRQALWTLQAKGRLFAPGVLDPQEVELRQQLLPKLQAQALMSQSVLGWASVVVEQSKSPYMLTTLRLDLIEAYALLGKQDRVNELVKQLNQGDEPHSYLTQRIEHAQRLSASSPTPPTEALLSALDLVCASASIACPTMLRAPARQALSTLWPPHLYQRGALEAWAENQRLRDLIKHGDPMDIALSVPLYCHYNRGVCLSTLKQHASTSKDPALLAQTQLLNLLFFYAEEAHQQRLALMWSYYWLVRERGELGQAAQWLEQQGLPLILKERSSRRRHEQMVSAAERLLEHGRDARASALLRQLQGQARRPEVTHQMILIYTKRRDVKTALDLFDRGGNQSVDMLSTILQALATSEDRAPLERIDAIEDPTSRYHALTKVAAAFAAQGDASTAKTLLKRADTLKAPPKEKLTHAYLDGTLHHLRALIALKDSKATMSLAQEHIKALELETSALLRHNHLKLLLTTADELDQEALFELVLKPYMQLIVLNPGSYAQDEQIMERLILKRRYKQLIELLQNSYSINDRSNRLSVVMRVVEKLRDERPTSIEPTLIQHLQEQLLELAKARSVYGELADFSRLCVKLQMTQQAIDVARTLYNGSAYKGKHTYSLKVAAGALIKQGAPTQGMQLYGELQADYERIELLRTLSEHIGELPDESTAQLLLQDLMTRVRGLPKARQDDARALVPLALANLNACQRAVDALEPTQEVRSGGADDELMLAAKQCIYQHKPAQALELIDQIHLETNKARALIQVGYYLDLSGQSRLPEVQAILKRVAKAH